MTDSDENLLAAAKLREAIRGDLDHGDDAYPHTGIVQDRDRQRSVSFVESLFAGGHDRDRLDSSSFEQTNLGRAVLDAETTEAATEAVKTSNGSVLSHFTGITERDLDGSSLRLPLRVNALIENNEAPAFILATGNPNSGKTNTLLELVEIRDYVLDDLMVLSNIRSFARTDRVVTSAHSLATELIRHRDRPKFVIIDEGSTHFDARTYSRDVAIQFTPLAKRFAKIGVDAFGAIGHTGKDIHPELKRLTTFPIFKTDKEVMEIYESWPSDADFPDGHLFTVDDLEPTSFAYDPDDAAPWAWDLRAELFSKDLDWPELLEALEQQGPDPT
jgi:hypothetical protein